MAIALYARKSIERKQYFMRTQIEYCKSVIKPDERSEKPLNLSTTDIQAAMLTVTDFRK